MPSRKPVSLIITPRPSGLLPYYRVQTSLLPEHSSGGWLSNKNLYFHLSLTGYV
jgi:hypothetical protein